MKTYVIRREKAWQNAEELEATAARSKEVAESDFPEDISWIRSYVIAEPGGTLGTVCIYQASGAGGGPRARRAGRHARRRDPRGRRHRRHPARSRSREAASA